MLPRKTSIAFSFHCCSEKICYFLFCQNCTINAFWLVQSHHHRSFKHPHHYPHFKIGALYSRLGVVAFYIRMLTLQFIHCNVFGDHEAILQNFVIHFFRVMRMLRERGGGETLEQILNEMRQCKMPCRCYKIFLSRGGGYRDRFFDAKEPRPAKRMDNSIDAFNKRKNGHFYLYSE